MSEQFISPIIEPMVSLTSPLSQAFAGEDLSLGSTETMNLPRELIPLLYAYAYAYGDTPVVMLGDELHNLPRIQEYVWATIMEYTGIDTRPVIFGVTQTAVTEKTKKPINWIRGYDWERGEYGALNPKGFLNTLNHAAERIGLDPDRLKVLGLDEYDRVFIGLMNGIYKDHLLNNVYSESKVSDILEAGLILTHYPAELVAKYSVNSTNSVNPSQVTNRIAREGLVSLLSILNSRRNNQGVGVKEIRFFADFKDCLKFDTSLKQWVYVGGYDGSRYDANELAQQTTGVVNLAECWEDTKIQIEPKKYKKSFSLFSQKRKEIPKSCKQCPLRIMCKEFATNNGDQLAIATPDVETILGLLARYLARVRAGVLHTTGTSAKAGNQMYYIYSPKKLKPVYYRVDHETAEILPLQGLIEVPFSLEGYERYIARNYPSRREVRPQDTRPEVGTGSFDDGSSRNLGPQGLAPRWYEDDQGTTGRSGSTLGQQPPGPLKPKVENGAEKEDPFGKVPEGVIAIDTVGSDDDYVLTVEPGKQQNFIGKGIDVLRKARDGFEEVIDQVGRFEKKTPKPLRFIEELTLQRKKQGNVYAILSSPPGHPLDRIISEAYRNLERAGKKHDGLVGCDILVEGDKVRIRMYFKKIGPREVHVVGDPDII